jgi:D-alanyl-D-alanine carboxypeptidase
MTNDLPLDLVDQSFAEFFASGTTPSLAYGVIARGQLVHFAGLGNVDPSASPTPPDVDTVYRIASMTKSFTAAAVLLLRDRHLLDLDEPVGTYVAELRKLDLPTSDAPALTSRHLLTMTGGLPTDDPWADRRESMPTDQFSALLKSGFSFIAAPGEMYEYSDLGYAILGRVIEAAASESSYHRFVERELLGPLGMTSTSFDPVAAPTVTGYRRTGSEWAAVPRVGPGAFSPMGGLVSSIADIARWVIGFLDAYPPRDDGDAHPLARGSRREMQRQHRFVELSTTLDPSASGPRLLAASTGYGFGLKVEHFTDHGRVVSHAGGYPGYGSHMRWHPDTGLGVVTLSNATYAGGGLAATHALRALVKNAGTSTRPIRPWPSTEQAAEAVGELLAGYESGDALDLQQARALFADNVELDVPPADRLTALARDADLVGQARPTAGVPLLEVDGPAHATWSVPADRGRRDIDIRLTPERPPRVQLLQITAIPDSSPELLDIAKRLVHAIAEGDPRWPADLRADEAVDRRRFERAAILAWACAPEIDAAPRRRAVQLREEPVAADSDQAATFTVVTGEVLWALNLAVDAARPDEPGRRRRVRVCTLLPCPVRTQG